jgi:tRNA-dihydrouridine synthase
MQNFILAPLRGVTIRCFRETFADIIAEGGFTEAVTPFISAIHGVDPLNDRELKGGIKSNIKITPQFIGKDPVALRNCLSRIKEAGFDTADINCGCPFPMVRNKGRGSGLLQHPQVFEEMLEAGCDIMGPNALSIKVRLGVERKDELLSLMPVINKFPLRFLVVHGRVAKQMYSGKCDQESVNKVCEVSRVPVILNGDLPFPVENAALPTNVCGQMVGRSFVRYLGLRPDASELVEKYVLSSLEDLHGEHSVLGRMKELLAYWSDMPKWRGKWAILKLCRTLDEFISIIHS